MWDGFHELGSQVQAGTESDHMDRGRKPNLGPRCLARGMVGEEKHTCPFPARLFPAGLHLWADMWEEFLLHNYQRLVISSKCSVVNEDRGRIITHNIIMFNGSCH